MECHGCGKGVDPKKVFFVELYKEGKVHREYTLCSKCVATILLDTLLHHRQRAKQKWEKRGQRGE
jgi:hypothetical protein